MKLSLVLLASSLSIATASPVHKGKRNQYHPRSNTHHDASFHAPANNDVDPSKPTTETTALDKDPSGISPWKDNGRSEAQDYRDHWIYCSPRYLNCRRCPQHPRCRRFPFPYPDFPPTLPGSLLPGEFGALTGPQLYYNEGLYEEGGFAGNPSKCPLSRCGEAGGGECDYTTATCVQGYCACPQGAKAAEGKAMTKGVGYPWDTRVFVDVGVACNQLCQTFSCEEVERSGVCVQGEEGRNAGPIGGYIQGGGQDGYTDIGSPTYQSPGSGAGGVPNGER